MLSFEIEKLAMKMTNECKKVKKFCIDKFAEIEDKTKCNSSKPNPFRVTGVDKKKKKKGVPYAPQPTDDEDDDCDTNVNNIKAKKVVFNECLMPTKQNGFNEMSSHAIHVSQFSVNKKVEEIIDHVMNNTSIINPSDFMVEKLSNHKSDFASFKISTHTREMYEEIKNIWHPYYYARDFRPPRNNFNSNMKTNGRFDGDVRGTSKFNFKKRQHNDRNEKSVRENYDSRRHFPNKFNERENYETPKRYNGRYGKTNDVQRPSQPQYFYIPVQQPVSQLMQQAQPTFLSQPTVTQQIIPHTQQMYQTTQQQQPTQSQAL